MDVLPTLKQASNFPEQIMDKNIVSFIMISDDEDDVVTLIDAFKKDKIANPLSIEFTDFRTLSSIKRKRVAHSICIILLNIESPSAGGYKILKSICEDNELKNLKLFVITSSDEVKSRIDKSAFKISGYIEKPVTFDRFANAISVLNYKWQLTDGNGDD